jgi:5-formyltetrahydrofolate cyclo-ligase
VKAEKSIIRKHVRASRDAVLEMQHAEWVQRICAQALSLPAYHAAHTIHIFLSFQSEVDTRAIIEDAFRQGKRVVVPVFQKDSAETPCTQITSLDDSEFIFGKWNMRMPKVMRPVPIDEIDIVFVPLVAYAPLLSGEALGVRANPRFSRIGYGAGFYDRFLARLSPNVPKIGLAFTLQRVDHIPIEPHDMLLNDVLTEE